MTTAHCASHATAALTQNDCAQPVHEGIHTTTAKRPPAIAGVDGVGWPAKERRTVVWCQHPKVVRAIASTAIERGPPTILDLGRCHMSRQGQPLVYL